jgi:pimeloyl-ACP methyl ester carboxylesterase
VERIELDRSRAASPREVEDPEHGRYSARMRLIRAIIATFLLPAIAVAQEHVSFPTQDGGVVHADLYGKSDRAVVLAHGGRFNKESWKKQAEALFLIARGDLGPSDIPRLPKVREQFAKAPGTKELIILEGSAHAQFRFATDQGDRVMREILRFLSKK